MAKRNRKKEPPGEPQSEKDLLLLAAVCYQLLTGDTEPPIKKTRAECGDLFLRHIEGLRKTSVERMLQLMDGEDADSPDPILETLIGNPKRQATSLYADIADVIEATFQKTPFTLPRLVTAMQKRGLPCLPNETRSLTDELTEAIRKSESTDLTDWILVSSNHCKYVRATLFRHSKKFPDRVRPAKGTKGFYIHRDYLQDYVELRHMHRYQT